MTINNNMIYSTVLIALVVQSILLSTSVSAFTGLVPPRHYRSSPASAPAVRALYSTTSSTTAASSISEDDTNSNLNYDDYDKVILFDGVCNFCNTWVDILLRVDTKEQFRFTPLQSPIGQQLLLAVGKEKDDISSVVLIAKDNDNSNNNKLKAYDKSNCVLQVVQELGPIAKIATKGAQAVVPLPIRNGIYDTVAENRYNFMGKRDQCRSGDPKYFDRFL